MIKQVIFFFFLFLFSSSFAQDYKERFESIDVQEYEISIELNDTSDQISVVEMIKIRFLKPATSFVLDLKDQDGDRKGMKILQLKEGDKDLIYTHSNSKITIQTDPISAGQIKKYRIVYQGIPKDGLVISKNKFGDRTFFGDNWPNRAQNWIACVDHPSDKAQVTFRVEVPNHYKVVANGELKMEVQQAHQRKLVEYYSSVEIPTKVMVIGVADFNVEQAGQVENTSVSSWVYPQNKTEGFYDLAQAPEILKFFIHHFGEYPYSKLANVQSTTRFGGMENASCIFYDENSITGKRTDETLIAHEIAHQWFGNSASEMGWCHLWLSEGFATYCTNLYIEEKQGVKPFQDQLKEDRQKVIRFDRHNHIPVIDTISKDLMFLLNANSYQKGGWVLHMLRRKIGDDFFWKGMRNYYANYKLSNATSADFIRVMEETSGMNLASFFHQWLQEEGHPELKVQWKNDSNVCHGEVSQVQKSRVVFDFPLEVEIVYTDNTSEVKTIQVNSKNQAFKFKIVKEVKSLKLDPNVNLLFEEVN